MKGLQVIFVIYRNYDKNYCQINVKEKQGITIGYFYFIFGKAILLLYNTLDMNLEKFASPKNIIKKIFSFGSPRNSPLRPEEDVIKDRNIVINVTLMGADCVGKSVFLNKDKEDKFEVMEPTLGVTFSSKKLTIGNLDIELKIWDTNGHEKYRSVIPVYITDDQTPKMCVIFYDVTDRKSFEQVETFLKIWRQKVSTPTQKDSILIVANKVDADFVGQSHVTLEEGLEISKIYQAVFLQSSSLFEVSHVFNKMVEFKLSQLGIRMPVTTKEESRVLKNGNQSQNCPIEKITAENKNKLLKLLMSLENLRTKILACKFNAITNKYLKTIQLKIVWEEKMDTLHRTQYSLRKLKLQTPTPGTYCFEQNKKKIEILEHIKNTELTQIKKIQKIIVSYLPKQEESEGQMNQLRQIKKLYQKYLELYLETQDILKKSELQQETENLTLDVFVSTYITYIQNLDYATRDLQQKAYRNIQESVSDFNEEKIIKDLINCFIISKCQSAQDQNMSGLKQTQNKEETNLILLGMVKKDQKFVDENLSCIPVYLKKVREFVQNIVTDHPQRAEIEKQVEEHNKSMIEKQWRAIPNQQRK